MKSDSRLHTAKDKTFLQSLIDFSHPRAPFVHLIFCIFFLFVLYFLYIYLLSFCPMPFSLGLYTYNFFKYPSITFMKLKKHRAKIFFNLCNQSCSDRHSYVGDRQTERLWILLGSDLEKVSLSSRFLRRHKGKSNQKQFPWREEKTFDNTDYLCTLLAMSWNATITLHIHYSCETLI